MPVSARAAISQVEQVSPPRPCPECRRWRRCASLRDTLQQKLFQKRIADLNVGTFLQSFFVEFGEPSSRREFRRDRFSRQRKDRIANAVLYRKKI
jgi:hypothetical protein